MPLQTEYRSLASPPSLSSQARSMNGRNGIDRSAKMRGCSPTDLSIVRVLLRLASELCVADRPFKHGRVDESGFWMRVTGRIAARTVFDEHALDALAGDVRQLVLIHESHFGVLRLRRVGDDAAERQGGEKQ